MPAEIRFTVPTRFCDKSGKAVKRISALEGITMGSHKIIDLTGRRFGKLVVLGFADKFHRGSSVWVCQCDCGNKVEISSGYLRRKRTPTRSCGCLRISRAIETSRKEFGESTTSVVYKRYRRGAIERGFDFRLSRDEFISLAAQNCHYCGAPPSNLAKSGCNNGDFIYSGLDRKDNTKGYSVSNCVPSCFVCNRAKSTMMYEEFQEYLNRFRAQPKWWMKE